MQYITHRSKVVPNGKSFSIQGYKITGEPEPLEKCLTYTTENMANSSLTKYRAHMRINKLKMTMILVRL